MCSTSTHVWRGTDKQQSSLISYISSDQCVPKTHPFRPIRKMVDKALTAMNPSLRESMRRKVALRFHPEYPLRTSLMKILYTIRSERQLIEQLDYNPLFCWFVGLSTYEPIWNHSTFSKNRERLIESDITPAFFVQFLAQVSDRNLLSGEHVSVDGTLIEAWASMKSFRRKDDDDTPRGGGRNGEVDFHGEKRTNDTHQSTTDPHARLFRKGIGREAKLCYIGHTLMDNRNGLIVDVSVTQATGKAEREAVVDMIALVAGRRRITQGADKGYDNAQFVDDMRACNVPPHVAQNHAHRHVAIDNRTTRHPGYDVSMKIRKRIDEGFGWTKTIGLLHKTHLIGLERINFQMLMTFEGFNLARMRNIEREVMG